MSDTNRNLILEMTARTNLAGLREVVDRCDDKETARPIYREILRLAHKLALRHDFEIEKERRSKIVIGKH